MRGLKPIRDRDLYIAAGATAMCEVAIHTVLRIYIVYASFRKSAKRLPGLNRPQICQFNPRVNNEDSASLKPLYHTLAIGVYVYINTPLIESEARWSNYWMRCAIIS